MRTLAPLVLVLLLPTVAASGHVAVVEDVRVETASQRLTITWRAVPQAAGYVVDVYAEGDLVRQYNTTSTEVVHYGQNHRPYAVVVRARAADGELGPASVPVAAVATEPNDLLYLAAGLSVLWVGLWLHALLVARGDARVRARLDRIHQEKQRIGERK